MDGRSFKQLFFLSIILVIVAFLSLLTILIYDFKCGIDVRLERNTQLIEYLNHKFGFCYNSELKIGENTLRCYHPRQPYQIICADDNCDFQILEVNQSVEK